MLLQYDCKYLMVQTSNITMVMMPCLSFLRSVINMQGVTTKSALIQYSYKVSMSQPHPLGPCHKITVFITYYIIYSTLPLFHIHLQIMTSLLTPQYYYFHHPKRNTSTSILLTVQQKKKHTGTPISIFMTDSPHSCLE